MKLTTLCYIEKDGCWLVLCRTKKDHDEALDEREDFFSLKLRYQGEEQVEANRTY